MSTHTKGPWEIRWDHRVDAEGLSYVAGFNIETEDGAEEIVGVEGIEGWKSNSEANARLIAAAPELLEACLLVRHLCEPGNALEKLVGAAIAKATGEGQ